MPRKKKVEEEEEIEVPEESTPYEPLTPISTVEQETIELMTSDVPIPLIFPEPPIFVGWSYTAQEIEDFRKAYNKFLNEYKRLKHEVAPVS